MQPKVNAVHEFLSLCISERRQRKSSLKAGNFAAPKKVATFHIEFVLIQDVPLTRSTWLTCGVLAGARSQFCDPAARAAWRGNDPLRPPARATATLSGALITSFREKLATRRCGRWERRDCLLLLGSKFCLVSFEITGGTCWGAFLYHGNLESLPWKNRSMV